ncbi:hypothetical protein, partial [Brevibacterium antiquum]|uniref:hypothetical protein n=1 Tax=Brevibacterium antiquum TaxID=234835 RepID=UPI001C60EC4D
LLFGAPGEIIGFLPVSPFSHPAGRPMVVLSLKVLQRPVESAQYTSTQLHHASGELGLKQSVGRTGVCLLSGYYYHCSRSATHRELSFTA